MDRFLIEYRWRSFVSMGYLDMKLLKLIIVITMILIVNACGGGGGSTPPIASTINSGNTNTNTNTITSGNTNTNTNTGVRAIGLRANFSNAAYITLTNSTTSNNVTKVGSLNIQNKYLKRLFDAVVPSAYASASLFNNVLAFDSNGNPIANPLTASVNLFISGVTTDPSGNYVFLGVDDHQNSKLYSDYQALQGEKCTLYRINKQTGEVRCLASSDKFDFCDPATNQLMLGNVSESFIKFDSNGNGYLIMARKSGRLYGSGGTGSQRLIKIDLDGNLSVVTESAIGFASGVSYAKNEKIFYAEQQYLNGCTGDCSRYKTNSQLLDPKQGVFDFINSLLTVGNQVVTSVGGEIYANTGNSLYWIDQTSKTFRQIYSGGDPIVWLLRSPSGSIYSFHYSGGIYSLSPDGREIIGNAGVMPLSIYKNNISDIIYPPIATNGEYIIAKGTDVDGLGQYCAIRLIDKKSRCVTLTQPNAKFLSVAIVSSNGYIYYDNGAANMMVSFDLASFTSGTLSDPTATYSNAGDGSMVAAISMRPPISFVADLTGVTTTASDRMLSISNPVSDTYTYLSFTSASSIAGVVPTDLGLKNSSGIIVDAKFKIVDKVIYAAVTDTSGTKSSGFQTLGSTNDYSLVFPSSYTAPALTNGIGTKTGYFPVVQRSSIMYLDFSAPVVNLDLAALQLTDASGNSIPSTISMAKEGLRLEIRVKDSDAANLTGFKILPTGSVYKLTLPSRVRLPGQTFLSPFDKTQIVFTTKS